MEKPCSNVRAEKIVDRQTDSFSSLYSKLAEVPALSCRVGRVPYNRAFGTFMGGCVLCDRAFGALLDQVTFYYLCKLTDDVLTV